MEKHVLSPFFSIAFCILYAHRGSPSHVWLAPAWRAPVFPSKRSKVTRRCLECGGDEPGIEQRRWAAHLRWHYPPKTYKKLLKMAIYSGFTHYTWWFSIGTLVCQTDPDGSLCMVLGPSQVKVTFMRQWTRLPSWSPAPRASTVPDCRGCRGCRGCPGCHLTMASQPRPDPDFRNVVLNNRFLWGIVWRERITTNAFIIRSDVPGANGAIILQKSVSHLLMTTADWQTLTVNWEAYSQLL